MSAPYLNSLAMFGGYAPFGGYTYPMGMSGFGYSQIDVNKLSKMIVESVSKQYSYDVKFPSLNYNFGNIGGEIFGAIGANRSEKRAGASYYEVSNTYSVRKGDIWNGHRVTSTFGHRHSPTNGASSNHRGIDLAYKNNEPFKSLSKGVVVNVVKNHNGYGNYVDVRDENGVVHRYAHANAILVNVGDEVAIGTVLGRAGATGVATGPHLHYERIENGVKVNPVGRTSNFTVMA